MSVHQILCTEIEHY